MKITIKDIARIAGVSTATVSMVLNGKSDHISDATKEKIFDIAKTHNYVPNTMARSLVTKKTKTIGLVIPDIANPFFPEIARGAEDKASEEGYNIIFCNTDDDTEKEERYVNMLIEKMVDGIIFTASSKRSHWLHNVQSQSIPIVLLDRDIPVEGNVGRIIVDNAHGTYEGTKYLIEKGYEKIALINGNIHSGTAKARLEGYKKAFSEFGLKIEEDIILEGAFKREWGYGAVTWLLNQGIGFDAVVSGNDLIAIGVIRALKDSGKLIPNDVAVLGFDDIHMAKLVEPELSTISQPKYEMGYKASEMLINMIEKNENTDRFVIFDTKLIIRKST
ncbi:MAG: LacI family DNA-binding transcriptional regulator [Bacillota bacterium]